MLLIGPTPSNPNEPSWGACVSDWNSLLYNYYELRVRFEALVPVIWMVGSGDPISVIFSITSVNTGTETFTFGLDSEVPPGFALDSGSSYSITFLDLEESSNHSEEEE